MEVPNRFTPLTNDSISTILKVLQDTDQASVSTISTGNEFGQ